jgi:hypothetical protein
MMRMPDGSYYFGDFKEGKRHGAGMNVSANGVVYEGEFFSDMRDGCGCLWTKSGPAYFGDTPDCFCTLHSFRESAFDKPAKNDLFFVNTHIRSSSM